MSTIPARLMEASHQTHQITTLKLSKVRHLHAGLEVSYTHVATLPSETAVDSVSLVNLFTILLSAGLRS
jgi:hypothetical protein